MKKYVAIMLLIMLLVYGCTTQVDIVHEDTQPETTEDVSDEEEIVDQEVEEREREEPEIWENETIQEEESEQDLSGYDIVLTAEKMEDSVELSWTRFEGDFDFKYYKVVRSLIREKPEYPTLGTRDNPAEEDLIATIINRNQTTFTDTKPEGGVSYYAVTAVGIYNEKIHSNPIVMEFPDPKETPDQDIKLTAIKTEEGVELSWTKYEGDFLFYKVVWTNAHPYPKYPADNTIETIPYVNTTNFLDINPEPGINYYAVTIVRPDKSRFTSQRASVFI